ncbi:hypothetical protein EIQ04_04395 [Xanthomonas campestris pv. raphani]
MWWLSLSLLLLNLSGFIVEPMITRRGLRGAERLQSLNLRPTDSVQKPRHPNQTLLSKALLAQGQHFAPHVRENIHARSHPYHLERQRHLPTLRKIYPSPSQSIA